STRAATAATCGADADVPKKLGNVSGSLGLSLKGGKNDVLPPSGPVIWGVLRISGVTSGLPEPSRKIVVGPNDVNDSGTVGLKTDAAATATAPIAEFCPNVVGEFVSSSSEILEPKT